MGCSIDLPWRPSSIGSTSASTLLSATEIVSPPNPHRCKLDKDLRPGLHLGHRDTELGCCFEVVLLSLSPWCRAVNVVRPGPDNIVLTLNGAVPYYHFDDWDCEQKCHNTCCSIFPRSHVWSCGSGVVGLELHVWSVGRPTQKAVNSLARIASVSNYCAHSTTPSVRMASQRIMANLRKAIFNHAKQDCKYTTRQDYEEYPQISTTGECIFFRLNLKVHCKHHAQTYSSSQHAQKGACEDISNKYSWLLLIIHNSIMSRRTSDVFDWTLLEKVHDNMKKEVAAGPLGFNTTVSPKTGQSVKAFRNFSICIWKEPTIKVNCQWRTM